MYLRHPRITKFKSRMGLHLFKNRESTKPLLGNSAIWCSLQTSPCLSNCSIISIKSFVLTCKQDTFLVHRFFRSIWYPLLRAHFRAFHHERVKGVRNLYCFKVVCWGGIVQSNIQPDYQYLCLVDICP